MLAKLSLEFNPLRFAAVMGILRMTVKAICVGISATVIAIAGLSLCLPNVIWLRRSTIRISNQGQSVPTVAKLQIGDQTQDYRAIEPGECQFATLPRTSQGSLAVTLPPNHQLGSFCHTYVEGKMYHVDITVKDGKVLDCTTSLPILSNLWVLKAFI